MMAPALYIAQVYICVSADLLSLHVLMCTCAQTKYTKRKEREGEEERKRERKEKKRRPKLRVSFRLNHLPIMCKALGSIPNTIPPKRGGGLYCYALKIQIAYYIPP